MNPTCGRPQRAVQSGHERRTVDGPLGEQQVVEVLLQVVDLVELRGVRRLGLRGVDVAGEAAVDAAVLHPPLPPVRRQTQLRLKHVAHFVKTE